MDRIDENKYFVVKFLDNPFQDTERISCEHVCVPKSWLEWQSREDNIVRVWYPIEDESITEIRVRKREKKSDQWVSALAVLKLGTDIYEEAKIYIQHRTPLSAMVEEQTSKTNSSVHKNKATVNSMPDTLGYSISSKSANKITFKRSLPADSDKTAHRKRSRLNEPGESVDEVAGPSSEAFELSRNNQTLINKKSNDRNSTEKKQIVKQNASKANHSLHAKSVDQLLAEKCFKLMEELQKYLGTSLVQKIFNKIMKIDTSNSRSALTNNTNKSTSRDITVQAPKLNEEKRNEQTAENDSDDDHCSDDDCNDGDDINKHTKTKTNPVPIIQEVVPPKYDAKESEENYENNYNKLQRTKSPQQIKKVPPKYDATGKKEDDLDDVSDDDERRKIKTCPRQLKNFVLPPEYDANDSRWTLKYREPAPGLVELIEHSGVYVNKSRLEDCLNLERDSDLLGRLLLSEVFTSSALSTCSFTGKRAAGTYSNGINARPGLDKHAREVLLDFLEFHEGEGYRIQSRDYIIQSMCRKMAEMRQRHQINLRT